MKVLVLAGGIPQIELLNQLKSLGYFTILADYTKEPVAKSYADKFYQTSTLDVQAIKKISIDEDVDFLISVCTDQALTTVALISKLLELPCYISYRTCLNVTNKKFMKQVFDLNGIPTAKHIIVTDKDDMTFDGFQFPLVVKPVDCNSSKGVVKVRNKKDLLLSIERAIEFSRTKSAIVEEYVEGKELSVDIYVENGSAKVLCVSESRQIQSEDNFITNMAIYPVVLSTKIVTLIEETSQKIVLAFGLKNCPMIMQLKANDDSISILEFSARTGGGLKYRLIKLATGIDIIKTVVDLTLESKPHITPNMSKRHIRNIFLYCNNGEFNHLFGFKKLKAEGLIDEYYSFHSKGTVFDKVESSGDRVAGFTLIADTLEELEKNYQKVVRTIKIMDSDRNDFLNRNLLPVTVL